jgi:hypothetical protein
MNPVARSFIVTRSRLYVVLVPVYIVHYAMKTRNGKRYISFGIERRVVC